MLMRSTRDSTVAERRLSTLCNHPVATLRRSRPATRLILRPAQAQGRHLVDSARPATRVVPPSGEVQKMGLHFAMLVASGIASTESDADIVGWYPPGGARGQQTARAVDFP